MEKVKNILPFEDYSSSLKSKKSKSFDCAVKEFKDCRNNNLILEGSFNRLMSLMADKDFAIISAYRHEFSKEENIMRNRHLRGILNAKKMGVHQLVGHWLEAPSGVAYKDAKPEELTDIIERSYFIAKPDGMDYKEFKKIILDCLTIDGETQDCGLIHLHGGGYYCVYPNGSVDKIGDNLTIGKIAQAYSQYVKRLDLPFVFEGVERPSSNSGMKMFEINRIEYVHDTPEGKKTVVNESELKRIVKESIKKGLDKIVKEG